MTATQRLFLLLAAIDLDLALQWAQSLPRPGRPSDCAHCQYRQEGWRDGGWCYMFREQVPTDCAQFVPLTVHR